MQTSMLRTKAVLSLALCVFCFELIQSISGLYLQPRYQFNGFSFSISLVNTGDKQYCSIQAEDKINVDGDIYKLEVGAAGIENLTDGLCRTPQILESYLNLAFMNHQNLSISNVQLNKEGKLGVFVKYDLVNQQRMFSLFLNKINLSNDVKVDKLFKQYYVSDDRFCQQASSCYHPNITVYHSGRALVKTDGVANAIFIEATTGIRYIKGVHYLEFRIIRTRQNRIYIGAAPELKSLTLYPGTGEQKTGKALFATGNVFADDTNSNYNLGPFVAGDYVGVLLNMNNKTISFSINGRFGAPLSVVCDGYYFIVSLIDVGDSVEIAPSNCYHREN